MVEETKDTSTKPCCKNDNQEKKLVKATDLPIHGNPFPPKDVIIEERPGMLEVKIRSLRTMLQPYVTPFASAYEKTNDVVSIGIAHSQSGMQRLAENQSSVLNAGIIAGATLLGFGLARKRGIFKKLLFGTIFFGGALGACYPKDAEEKAQMLLYIARNKLPVLAKQQYEKLVKGNKQENNVEQQANGVKTVDKESKS